MNEEQKIAKTDEQSKALQTEAIGTEDAVYSPQVDIIEKKESVEVLADMPGVPKENVDLVMEEGVLTIDGKVAPTREDDLSLEAGEYGYGNYHRSFAVGDGLDTEGIEACMQDGVLKLTLPKTEKYKPKRIEIQ